MLKAWVFAQYRFSQRLSLIYYHIFHITCLIRSLSTSIRSPTSLPLSAQIGVSTIVQPSTIGNHNSGDHERRRWYFLSGLSKVVGRKIAWSTPNEVVCWICCHYREICREPNANIIVNNAPSENVVGVEIVCQRKGSNSTSWMGWKQGARQWNLPWYAMLSLVLCISDFKCSENLQTLWLANVLHTHYTFRKGHYSRWCSRSVLGRWLVVTCCYIALNILKYWKSTPIKMLFMYNSSRPTIWFDDCSLCYKISVDRS